MELAIYRSEKKTTIQSKDDKTMTLYLNDVLRVEMKC